MTEHKAPSASKRARLMRTCIGRVVDRGTSTVPRFIQCRATTRQAKQSSALKGCRETLAEIRYDDGRIMFAILAPVRDDNGVWVLERTAQPGFPERIAHPSGGHATFRCARCGGDTTVDLRVLARVARATVD